MHQIVESKQREVDSLVLPSAPLDLATLRRTLDVPAALGRHERESSPLKLIAEIKRKSPSAGRLSCRMTIEERALAYARAGASMVSVLCDQPFFDGGFDHVARVRHAFEDNSLILPILAKEFILDQKQLVLARNAGADAVLLIVRIVPKDRLRALVHHARDLELEPFVEVADEAEIESAVDAGARVIGVNARDLDTLAIDKAKAARALEQIPVGIVRVHLSGVGSATDVRAVSASEADAALIGEALMREDDPSVLLRSMVAEASR